MKYTMLLGTGDHIQTATLSKQGVVTGVDISTGQHENARIQNSLQYMVDQLIAGKGTRDAWHIRCIPVGKTKKRDMTTIGNLFNVLKPKIA